MRNILQKTIAGATTFALIGALAPFSAVQAASLSTVQVNNTTVQDAAGLLDIRQMAGEATDLTINFTLDASTTITENETITLTFPSGDGAGEFFTTTGLAFGDLDLEFSTSADATLAAAASATDWGVAVTNGAISTDAVITLTAPSTVATYVTASETITVQIGTVADGGTNQITNPTVSSEDAAGGNLGTSEETRYSVRISGDFGTESGVTSPVLSSVILPVLEDDRVKVTAFVPSELLFELHSGDTSATGGGATDDDDQTLKFYDTFDNNIDFGELSSTAARYATPNVAASLTTGGTAASNVGSGGAHGFRVATNSSTGFATTVWGETLTNGANTIDAISGAAAASSAGTEQFGLCLAIDTTGTYPTDATNTGDALADGVIAGDYDCGSGYRFDPTANGATDPVLNEVANSANPVAATFYDVEYLANIDALTETGLYTTVLYWNTTATF